MKPFKKLKLFLTLAWHISPSYLFLLLGSSLISAGQVLINVILPKYLIDELVGGKETERLLFWGGAIVVSNLIFGFLAKWMKRGEGIKAEYMDAKLTQAMAEKIMNIDYAYLEDPHYLDLKERAVFACTNQGALYNLVTGTAGIIRTLVTILSLLAVMLTLGLVLLAAIAVTIAVTLLIMRGFSKYQVGFFQSLIPVNRKYNYYINLAFEDAMQKDIRLYGINEMLRGRVLEYNSEIITWFTKYYHKQAKIMGLMSFAKAFHAAVTYGYVGLRVLTDKLGTRIGLGSFTMYVSASIQFTTSFQELLDSFIRIFQMLDYLDPFMEFMSLPEEKQEGQVLFQGPIETVCFEGVSFTYPKAEKKVLDNISFEIKKGEKISIVGLNGAGKTTLIKLICRLYHPTSGTIRINGRNIFEYDYESYMREIAAVFQDFKLFAFSIYENIVSTTDVEGRGSNKAGDPRPGLSKDGEVDEIINKVGLGQKVKELPEGINTLLGKSYDEAGIEMSGGQSQKLAIARALYKQAGMVILDEPTSALDPLAEADIYENFNDMVHEKTAIYISHRMSSSIFCDRILVIDGGKISDFDTHANLMQKTDSLYYKLFHTQAENYQIQ